jgi:hypothetical protein
MYDNSATNFPRAGFVAISGNKYPAEQQAPNGNFRKRATRYFKDGKWSEWCKDDHDLFTPCRDDGGRFDVFHHPEGASIPVPLQFPTWAEGARFCDELTRELGLGKAELYPAPFDTSAPLAWKPVHLCTVDGQWTRLGLVHCDDYDPATGGTKTEAVGNHNPRPVYLMHLHFAPGSLKYDHPVHITPVHAVRGKD